MSLPEERPQPPSACDSTDRHRRVHDAPVPDRRHLPLDVSGLPVEPVRPPDRAPNVVVVVIDDMGFGAPSPFGGPCHLPTADRLARQGLRYSRFHVTALCSPTRQALMTGRNHHSVGMGVTSEMATSHPGYSGFRPASAATLAQILHGNGWSTAAFGKWHQTPSVEVTAAGPFTRWPTGEGFDTFYGFMGAEMNHWYPQPYSGTTPVEPDRLPEEGYHLTEDLVDHAVDWVRTQQSLTPYRPFFTYLALGATHAPFHVADEWIQRYEGSFDQGWDVMREQILERQKQLGIVPPDAELAPWADGVPHWDELDDDAKRVAVRLMETYAGFAEHADQQVGRLVDALDSSRCSTTPCSSTCSATTAPRAKAASRAPSASTWSGTASRTTWGRWTRGSTRSAGRRRTPCIPWGGRSP